MTLDEAIKHAEEVAESKEKQVKNGDWEKDSLTERNCIKCAEEHRQLAEWLKDYKRLKEQEPLEVEAAKLQQAYNKGFEDCRQAAIKSIDEKAKRIQNADTLNGLAGAVAILFDLPSVRPQEKTGHWIKIPLYEKWKCSECDTKFRFTFKEHDYCPNCGARMVEPTCDTCEYTTAAFNPCNACKDKSEYKPQERSE